MMKRIISYSIVLVALLSLLAACGGNPGGGEVTGSPEAAEDAEASLSPGPTPEITVIYTPVPTLDYTGGLERDEDGVLIGSVVFTSPIMLMGMGIYDIPTINVRVRPNLEAVNIYCEWGFVTIGKGQMFEAYAIEDGWYYGKVLPGEFEGYIRSDLLTLYDEYRPYYAETLFLSDTEDGKSVELIDQSAIVDVRRLLPDIEYEMIYATPYNFTGQTQYTRDVPLLRRGTAEKLVQAQAVFRRDGYTIKLYDAYQPVDVAPRLAHFINYKTYSYDAQSGAYAHRRAAAVDITLVDADGNELEMPSQILHTFNATSRRNSSNMIDIERENMEYLTRVMESAGFTAGGDWDWWHFEDAQFSRAELLDIDFSRIAFTNR